MGVYYANLRFVEFRAMILGIHVYVYIGYMVIDTQCTKLLTVYLNHITNVYIYMYPQHHSSKQCTKLLTVYLNHITNVYIYMYPQHHSSKLYNT